MVVIILMLILTVPVLSQMRMRGEYGRGQYYALDITKLSDLDLTNEQVGNLKALQENYLRQIQPLRDQMYDKSIELKNLWLAKHPDRRRIETIESEVHIIQAELLEKNADYYLKSLKYLTDKQLLILKSCEIEQGRGYDRGMRGRGSMEVPRYLKR